MTSLIIRHVDDTTRQRLRMQAARHGVSMEEEARRILKEALRPTEAPSRLGTRLLGVFPGLPRKNLSYPSGARRPAQGEPGFSSRRGEL